MNDSMPDGSPMQDPIVKWLVGFFGALFGFMLLPRALKFFIRRFIFGTIGEIVAVVITGLLTEKAVEYISKEEDR